MNNQPNPTTGGVGGAPNNSNLELQQLILSREKLRELATSISPELRLDTEVEDLLLSIVDDFVDNAAKGASDLARLRKSAALEVKDLQLHLERNYNLIVPVGQQPHLEEISSATFNPPLEEHKARLEAIAKAKMENETK